MSKQLFLADLSDMTDGEVRLHIAEEYGGDGSDYSVSEEDAKAVTEDLAKYDILVAYEHVGSWGCDSSSYFLLRSRDDGDLFEFTGGHCSCYGFEGQYEPEKTSAEYILSDKFCFYGGGYDDDSDTHKRMIVDFVAKIDGED